MDKALSLAYILLGTKADLRDGKVPSSQLPSYVDDVIEVNNYASLPTTGETGKIYVTKDTGISYRWSGSVYIRFNELVDSDSTQSFTVGVDNTGIYLNY